MIEYAPNRATRLNPPPLNKDVTMRKRIAILDYGSQYKHLIARRIREKKVYSEVLPTSVTAAELPGAFRTER